MDYIAEGFAEAFRIILSADREFLAAVRVSLLVACTSTVLTTLVAVPFGIWVARTQFRGKQTTIAVLNTLMSLPTVLVGLLVYSLISYRGPLGGLRLLYTRTAIVIGQFILALPIVAGLTVAAVRSLDQRIDMTIKSLGADNRQGFRMFLHEARFGVLAAVIAGFGRVFAEVGVSMMLGGNIKAYTRNITTAIALATSKGQFALGIALGLVLLIVAFGVNGVLVVLQKKGTERDRRGQKGTEGAGRALEATTP